MSKVRGGINGGYISKVRVWLKSFPLINVVPTSVDRTVAKWHHQAMIPVAEESRSRITARVPDRMRETLEQAAELMGSTVNQFVVQSAYQEAQRILERESVIRLSREDALKILSLMEHPPKPNKRLKEAVRLAKSAVRA
jgi:uncharacterized protein (DUF1778 family)